ncbi:D-alanyl-D-alanine carboxypeptidase family protein [Bacillus marinisedimentorum]|uniref:D-alanyl-D-alanine carboxypeptidase family protein n=1 Tax=Bacillus marinisedimentorum TaxID=1821260 RepID=UPI001FE00FAB|nr:D-alanyl-D-alanine carboxypeptidase family protein [Bacillus marinisedimentorum]
MILAAAVLLPANPASAAVSGEDKPDIQSETAILADIKSGTVLFEKDGSRSMYPASITKIATAALAIEEGDLDDVITVSKEATEVEGTTVYLEEGEEVPLKKLIQGMMINSGNDASYAIAEYLEKNGESFESQINHFLQERVKVENTYFTNPHGLFEESHVTTAKDMAMITAYAMENPEFREIFGTNELPWKGKSWDTTLLNHNKLLRLYEGATGGKNGYVSKAGFTLVTTASRGNSEWAAVVMNAPSSNAAYRDTRALLDYGFDHFTTHSIDEGTELTAAGNKTFKVDETLYYTAGLNEETDTSVSESGILTVTGEGDRTLLNNQLKRPAPSDQKSTPVNGETTGSTESSSLFSTLWSLKTAALAAAAVLFLFIMKRIIRLIR